jgi:hypothetical protein
MTELEKAGVDLAKTILSIPTWDTGSGKDFFELKKVFWDAVVRKAREYVRVAEEAGRK